MTIKTYIFHCLNFIIVVLTVYIATGCFKKVSTDTTVIIKTLVQEVSGGENIPAESVDAYAYYPSSEDWTILSYDDAVNYTITNPTTGEQRNEPDVKGVPFERFESGCYTSLPLTKSPAMIVVVEPQKKMYAYMFKLLSAENLHETYITLIFHTWRDKEYTEGSKTGYIWNVFPSDNVNIEDGASDENKDAD